MISHYAGAMMGSDLTASIWHSFQKIDNEQALREVVASIAHGHDGDDDNASHKLHRPPFNTLTSHQWSQVFDANAKMSTISYAQSRRGGEKTPGVELPATVIAGPSSTDGDSDNDDDDGNRTPKAKTGAMDMKQDYTMKQQMQRQSAAAAARATSAARVNAVARQAATRSAGGR
jgi:hypothetical protein